MSYENIEFSVRINTSIFEFETEGSSLLHHIMLEYVINLHFSL